MYGRYYTFPRVGKEYRDTIGRSYSYSHSRKICNHGIITFEIFPSDIRPVYDSYPRPVYLMALDDGIREDGIPSGGKSFYTRAKRIVKKVLKLH